MAIIRGSCRRCSAVYQIDEVHRGKRGRCTNCDATFVIDGVPAATVSPPKATRPKARPCGPDGTPLDWEPGDVILDLYEVRKLPGTSCGYAEGGMGRVNLVRHTGWGKDLAVKS